MSNAEHRETRRLVANLLVITGRQPEHLELAEDEQKLARKLFDGENDARRGRGEPPICIGKGVATAQLPNLENWLRAADFPVELVTFLTEKFPGGSLLDVVTSPVEKFWPRRRKGLGKAVQAKLEQRLGSYGGLRLGMTSGDALRVYNEWLHSHAADNGVAWRPAAE